MGITITIKSCKRCKDGQTNECYYRTETINNLFSDETAENVASDCPFYKELEEKENV